VNFRRSMVRKRHPSGRNTRISDKIYQINIYSPSLRARSATVRLRPFASVSFVSSVSFQNGKNVFGSVVVSLKSCHTAITLMILV
jgi:hypothetical protein